MLSLMLDLKFKNLHIISSFIGREEGVVIIEEYDKKYSYPMFLKCYHQLHQMAKTKVGFTWQTIIQDYNYIFEQIVNTCEFVKNLFTRELLIFKCYQMDSKKIKCFLQWWRKYEAKFSNVGFLVCQILGLQIETICFYSKHIY
jgi:hypothetical protein